MGLVEVEVRLPELLVDSPRVESNEHIALVDERAVLSSLQHEQFVPVGLQPEVDHGHLSGHEPAMQLGLVAFLGVACGQ